MMGRERRQPTDGWSPKVAAAIDQMRAECAEHRHDRGEPTLETTRRADADEGAHQEPEIEACGSPKERPHVVGAISGDSDRSAKGILDAHPIGFPMRNV